MPKKPIKTCVIIKNVDADKLESLMEAINAWRDKQSEAEG